MVASNWVPQSKEFRHWATIRDQPFQRRWQSKYFVFDCEALADQGLLLGGGVYAADIQDADGA